MSYGMYAELLFGVVDVSFQWQISLFVISSVFIRANFLESLEMASMFVFLETEADFLFGKRRK